MLKAAGAEPPSPPGSSLIFLFLIPLGPLLLDSGAQSVPLSKGLGQCSHHSRGPHSVPSALFTHHPPHTHTRMCAHMHMRVQFAEKRRHKPGSRRKRSRCEGSYCPGSGHPTSGTEQEAVEADGQCGWAPYGPSCSPRGPACGFCPALLLPPSLTPLWDRWATSPHHLAVGQRP